MTESLDAYQWFLLGRLHFEGADEPRPARRDRGVRAGHGHRPELRARLRLGRERLLAPQLPRLCAGVETGPAQRAAAEKALLLDAGLAEAHLGLALALAFHERRWGDAEAAFRRALELDPNYATGHHWYAFFLQTLGRYDEALDERRRALEIDRGRRCWAWGSPGCTSPCASPNWAADAVERTLRAIRASGMRA